MPRPFEMLLKNAENCRELAADAVREPEKLRYRRMARSWSNLAETQAWLDGEKCCPEKSSPDDA